MEKFIKHTGIAAPLLQPNIDTDTIIPIIRLVALDISTLGRWAFEPLRYDSQGRENPDFVLNREPYRNASILLAGPNFGCGSSREGAVTALYQFGIRCIVAPSYGEIFHGNCFKNGLLPITLPAAIIERLMPEDSDSRQTPAELTVDLETSSITLPDGTQISYKIDAIGRNMLLKGLDIITLTLQHEKKIAGFQAKDRKMRPWIYDWKS